MVGFCLVINPKPLVSVKPLQDYSGQVLQQDITEDISIIPQMHSNFSQIHIYVATMGLGEWRKSTRLGKSQNTGLAFSICNPAFLSAQFASQAMCLGPNILFCPRSGNVACPKKPRQTWCCLLQGYVWLTFPEGKSSGK